MKETPLSLKAFLTAGTVIAAVGFATACGGKATDKLTLDPDRASSLARSALISSRDLPGSGWQITEENVFDDSNEQLTDSNACQEAERLNDEFDAKVEPQRAGRSQKKLERGEPGGFVPTTVEVSISVLENVKTAREGQALVARDIHIENIGKCLEDYFKETFGAQSSVEATEPRTSAPEGGFGRAFDASIPGIAAPLRFEIYSWTFGNAGVSVSLSGSGSAVSSELAKAAVEKTVAGLERASRGEAAPTETPATSTSAPVAAATPRATATPASSASGPGRFVSLADLSSYRYTMRMQGFGGPLVELSSVLGQTNAGPGSETSIEITGTYQAPDRGQMMMTIFGLQFTETIIGQQHWQAVGSNISGPELQPTDASDLSLIADFWVGDTYELVRLFGCSGRETIAGVATRKCGIGQQGSDALRGLFSSIGGDTVKSFTNFVYEVWLAEEGDYPVQIHVDMTGTDLADAPFHLLIDVNVRDVNSPAIRIFPPR